MSAPNITLAPPYVLLTQSDSTLGILPINGPFKFGTVQLVYSTSDRLVVGQSVIYDSSKTASLMYGSTIYLMVSDEFVTGQESALP